MKPAIFILSLTLPLFADANGAGTRLTGAPGEQTCARCHSGAAGSGSVKITTTSASYTPGVKQRLTVTVADPTMRRWGFQLTPTAGTLATVDANVRLNSQYANQTSAGSRNGTTGSVTFEVDWTPPATAANKITIYAAGLAANGNGNTSGDLTYTTSLELSAASNNPPAIRSGGVVNAASYQASIASGSWITIVGDNLAATTRSWASTEIVNGALPTALDGVSVTVNGKPAYVAYISPTQINAIAPDDTAIGPVEVRVAVNGQTSAAATATINTVTPSFFTFDGKYVATLNTPAKPGETVVLYANGLGVTNPAVAANRITETLAPVTAPVTVTIGGQPATVAFAGLVAPFARLYQVNVQVPAGLAAGDHAVVIQTGGVSSPSGVVLTVQP
jgi:uncharacterized protein (TIGR03437 family)